MTLPLVHAGKVRRLYEVGDDRLLMVATDAISAFDVVMAEPIPDKGRVLTAMTVHWAAATSDLLPNHIVTADPLDLPDDAGPIAASLGDRLAPGGLAGRTLLVRRAEMLPLECIVRGYLAGSGWKEYAARGTLHGQPLPAGLRPAERLPEPRFTPSTKPTEGHDENISFADAVSLVGRELAEAARDLSLAVYRRAASLAEARGIILADTKFELGLVDGRLTLCDEILTPDSSRFWPADAWAPGVVPPSFDKQPLRDWLERTGWDKRPPPPALPDEVVRATTARYRQAYERLCGRSIDDWIGGVR